MDALFYYSAAAYGALHGSWLVEESWKKKHTERKKTEDGENRANQTPGTVLRLLTAAAGIGLAGFLFAPMTMSFFLKEDMVAQIGILLFEASA